MAKTFRQLLNETRGQVSELSPEDAKKKLDAKEAVAIDIRERDEVNQGHLPGAVVIPRGFLEIRVEEKVPDKNMPLVVYCASGTRSLLAARALKELGYENVASMSGGYSKWKDSGFPWVVPQALDASLRKRYDRHLLIPEVGEAGQLKLLASKVLLIGAGGLGSPIALYLAAAGVGTIGLIDSDVVDESNLQRQVVHTTDRIGMPKVDSAEKAILALNPTVKVRKFQERLTSANVLKVFEGFDLVVDGSDNFATRYVVNDACFLARRTLVAASLLRFEGQLSTFKPHAGGPCYRCLHPVAPPPGTIPRCEEAGILGAVAGVMGTLQAAEAVKELLGLGDSLAGTLLIYDALGARFTRIRVAKDPDCPVCGEGATAATRS